MSLFYTILFLFINPLFSYINRCNYHTISVPHFYLSGGTPKGWSDSCLDSANDISERLLFPEYIDCIPFNSWGPYTNNYPLVQIPDDCDPISWQELRFLKVVDYIVSLDLNYCHHHNPSWIPMDSLFYRRTINENGGVCRDRGQNGKNQWNGVDCSSYSSFVYNFAFGTPFITAIRKQACGPEAPGKVLDITKEDIKSGKYLFKPGDLLYIEGLVGNVTHVIIWTGYILKYDSSKFGIERIINNYSPDTKEYALKAAMNHLSKNETVYIITDSTWTGPNYRMFLGWYTSGFSHARRVINPDESLKSDCETNFN